MNKGPWDVEIDGGAADIIIGRCLCTNLISLKTYVITGLLLGHRLGGVNAKTRGPKSLT